MLVLTAAIALAAGVTRSLRRFLLATVPIVVSILLVNSFLYPGATDVLFRVGPFTSTGTGVTVALQATLRVVAFALSVAVFSLTTATDDFLADLEHRGAGRRITFVVGSAIGMIPAMASRAAEIVDAQRARASTPKDRSGGGSGGSCRWPGRWCSVPSPRSRSGPSRWRLGHSPPRPDEP